MTFMGFLFFRSLVVVKQVPDRSPVKKEVEIMIQVIDEQSYGDGEIIWEEGSFGDWFYMIEAGTVELSRKVKGEKLVVDVLKKEDIFGEVGYVIETPRLFTARAVGPTTLGIVDRESLDREYNQLVPSFKTILKVWPCV